MKEFIKSLYKNLYNEDLVEIVEKQVVVKEYIEKTPEKTPGDRFYELAKTYYQIDPTPEDKQPDEVACVETLTTILKKLYTDIPVMTYTPTFLSYIQGDWRFKPTTEFKKGNIIISPTGTGNGSIVGHTGVCGEDGKILSNDSSTGLWFDKYDNLSWVDRYSRGGKLKLYLFELTK